MGKTSESHFSEIDHNTYPGLRHVHGLTREVMMASCPRQWFVNGGDPFSSIFIQNIQIIFIIYWNWVYIYIKISYSQTNHNKFLNLALALGSLQRASSSFPVTSKSQPSATLEVIEPCWVHQRHSQQPKLRAPSSCLGASIVMWMTSDIR